MWQGPELINLDIADLLHNHLGGFGIPLSAIPKGNILVVLVRRWSARRWSVGRLSNAPAPQQYTGWQQKRHFGMTFLHLHLSTLFLSRVLRTHCDVVFQVYILLSRFDSIFPLHVCTFSPCRCMVSGMSKLVTKVNVATCSTFSWNRYLILTEWGFVVQRDCMIYTVGILLALQAIMHEQFTSLTDIFESLFVSTMLDENIDYCFDVYWLLFWSPT